MNYIDQLLAKAKRDKQIRSMRLNKGWTMQRLADYFGITRQRVQQILSKP